MKTKTGNEKYFDRHGKVISEGDIIRVDGFHSKIRFGKNENLLIANHLGTLQEIDPSTITKIRK